MPGGRFNYQQYTISDIADVIEDILANRQDEGEEINLPSYIVDAFKEGVKHLRRAKIYTHRIDYYLSGNDNEESFITKLQEELAELEKVDAIGIEVNEPVKYNWEGVADWIGYIATQKSGEVWGFKYKPYLIYGANKPLVWTNHSMMTYLYKGNPIENWAESVEKRVRKFD